jgi:hypothetical protein
MINITVYADEVLFGLDQLPRKIRESLGAKFQTIFADVRQELSQTVPGKYIDQRYIQSGVEQIGSLQIGFIEAEDKPGFYVILPTKARALRFIAKSGDLVMTKRVLHPYLKGAPIVAQYLETKKPWIFDQLESAVIEAL